MFSSAGFLLRRHRAVVIWFAVLVAISGLTWWLGARLQAPHRVAAAAHPPLRTPILAPVEHRVLARELVLRGTVRARNEQAIDLAASPGEELSVVTEPPPEPGDRIGAGSRLIEVSGRPVFALAGAIPMYRELHTGMEGEDIAQLQRALTRLGYGTGGTGGVFGPGTASAVRQFYEDRGYEPPTRPVTTATTPSPGSKEPGPGGGPAGENPLPPESMDHHDGQRRRHVVVPYSEIYYLPELPVRVTRVSTSVGDEPRGTLMKVATGELVVEATAAASQAGVVEPGAKVSVEARAGETEFTGTVSRVSTRPGDEDKPAGPEPSPGAAEVIRMTGDKPIEPALRGEKVTVTMRLASTGTKVLVVPVSALWSRADGRSYVSVQASPGGATHKVTVETGLSADGHAAVTSDSGRLHPGDRVVLGTETQP